MGHRGIRPIGKNTRHTLTIVVATIILGMIFTPFPFIEGLTVNFAAFTDLTNPIDTFAPAIQFDVDIVVDFPNGLEIGQIEVTVDGQAPPVVFSEDGVIDVPISNQASIDISSSTLNEEITALTVDPISGNLFATDVTSTRLHEVVLTGNSITSSSIKGVLDHTSKGLAFNLAGNTLYSVDRDTSNLKTINPSNAATLTTVAITLTGKTVTGSTGLATDPRTGDLYALLKLSGQSGRELVTLNPGTGVATSVGDTGDLFAGIAIDTFPAGLGLSTQIIASGNSLSQLGFPEKFFIDSSGNFYVGDEFFDGTFFGTVEKYDSSGTHQFTIQFFNSGDSFKIVRDVVVDSSGNIYALDDRFPSTGRVVVFNSGGTFVSEFATNSNSPGGMAIDSSDNIYVANFVSGVEKYDPSGTLLTTFTSGFGAFIQVGDVALDSSGNMYTITSDGNDFKIIVLDQFGNFLFDFGGGFCLVEDIGLCTTDAPGAVNPGDGESDFHVSIDVDSQGNIYVSDSGNDRVQKFDIDGNFLLDAGSRVGDVALSQAAGVAVDSNDDVFLAYADSIGIVKFESQGLLFGITDDGAAIPESLFTIDTFDATLEGTFVPLGEGDDGEAIAIDPSSVILYHASGSTSRILESFFVAPDLRVALSPDISFPAKTPTYGVSAPFDSGEGFAGPTTVPYDLFAFPDQFNFGPHDIEIELVNLQLVSTSAGPPITFDIGASFGANPAIIGIPNPGSLVIPPTGSVDFTVTYDKFNFGVENPTISLSLFAPVGSLTVERQDNPGVSITAFTFGALDTVVLDVTLETVGDFPGVYTIFFDAFGTVPPSSPVEQILDIPVTVVDASIPILLLSPSGVNPGGIVIFDAFNLSPGDTISLEIFEPGVGTLPLNVDSFSIEGVIPGTVDAAGQIQGTFTIPNTITNFGDLLVTLTSSPTGDVIAESILVFAVGGSDIILNVTPEILFLQPPLPPGVLGFSDGTVDSATRIADNDGVSGLTSIVNNDFFGSSSTEIGDLDNDGNDSIAVGAFGFDSTESFSIFEGRVFILELDSNQLVVSTTIIGQGVGGFTGTLDGNGQFGSSVAGLGDLDGDGTEDLAVTEPACSVGGTLKGCVWILFLNPDGTVSSNVLIADGSGGFTGPLSEFDAFGNSVANLGDLDGPLGPSVLALGIGTAGENSGEGSVWILFLDATGNVIAEQKISETSGGFTGILDPDDVFGRSIANIGDLDFDGVTDIAVGAEGDDDGFGFASITGVTDIDISSTSLNSEVTALTIEPTSGDLFVAEEFSINSDLHRLTISGGSVSSSSFLGDMDHISKGLAFNSAVAPDTLYSVSRDDNRIRTINPTNGATIGLGDPIFVLSGKSIFGANGLATDPVTGDLFALLKIQGQGRTLVTIDPLNDFLATEIGVVSPGFGGFAGIAFDSFGILFGITGDGAVPPETLFEISTADGTIFEPLPLGNGDDGEAIAIDPTTNIIFHASGLSSRVLESINFNDISVGAASAESQGAVWVLFLNSDGTVKSQQKISATEGGFGGFLDDFDFFGRSVAGIGDINADGTPDLAVGAGGDDDGSFGPDTGFENGALWILFLNPDGTVQSFQKISQVEGFLDFALSPGEILDGDVFGNSINTIEDVDGDGLRELVVGAFGDDGDGINRGAIYIINLFNIGAVSGFLPGFSVSFSEIGTFGEDIELFIEGLPPDVLVSFDIDGDFIFDEPIDDIPPILTTPNDPAFITVEALPGAPFGFFDITIVGVSTGTQEVRFVPAQISIPPPDEFGGTGSEFGTFTLNPPAGFQGDLISFNGFVADASLSGRQVELFMESDQLTTIPDPITVAADGSFSGSFTVPSSLPSTGFSNPEGFFGVFAEIDTPSGFFDLFSEFIILSSGFGFIASASPDFLPPVESGTTGADQITITVESLPGGASDTINVDVFGLPPDLGISFDGGTTLFGVPNTSLSLPAGGFASTTLTLDATLFPPPSPIFIGIDVCDSSFTSCFFFDIPSGITADTTFFTGDFALTSVFTSQNSGTAGADITIQAFGFTPNTSITFEMFGQVLATTTTDTNGDTIAVPVTIPSIDAGFYFIDVFDTFGVFGGTEFELIGAGSTFTVSVSPDFLPAIEQGTVSANTALVTVDVFSGKSLTGDQVVLEVFGLSPGVEAGFDVTNTLDDTQFSSEPIITLTIPAGGIDNAELTFKADDFAFPGPVDVFIDATSGSGVAWVLFMDADGTLDNITPQQKITTNTGGFTGAISGSDFFAGAFANLGDLDVGGPATTALAVGAEGDSDGGPFRGAVWILFMDTDGTVLSQQKISDTAGSFTGILDDFDEFGFSLAELGDLDAGGPSTRALAVGAPSDGDGGFETGAVWILFLDTDGTVLSEQKISPISGGFTGPLFDFDFFGTSLANLGDLDGAGPSVLALAVGAEGDSDAGFEAGAVWILFLDATGNVLSEQKITSVSGAGFTGPTFFFDFFGSDVINIGDLDGDGVDDLAVGASGDSDSGVIETGAVWILFMNTDGTVKSQQKISATEGGFGGALPQFSIFGQSVAALGDLDGDLIEDIAVGVEEDVVVGSITPIDISGVFFTSEATALTVDPTSGELLYAENFVLSGLNSDVFRLDIAGNVATPVTAFSLDHLTKGLAFVGTTLFSVPNNDATLRTINPVTGATTTSVPITLSGKSVQGATGLSSDPTNGDQLYAILKIQGQFERELVTLDDITGVATSIGLLDDRFAGIAFDSSGQLIGVTGDGGFVPESLFEISKTDASIGFPAKLGNGDDGEAIAIDHTTNTIIHASGLFNPILETIGVSTLTFADTGFERGAVWILFLNADGTVKSQQKISGTSGGFTGTLRDFSFFGLSLANAGDLDGDGIDDLVVGADEVEFHGASIFTSVSTSSTFFDVAFTDLFLGGGDFFGLFNAFTFGSVFIDPSTVPVGGTTTVTASGFTPNSDIDVEVFTGFTSIPVEGLPPTLTFDASGSQTIEVTIPSTISAGHYDLDVFDASGNFGTTPIVIAGSTDVFGLSVSPTFLPPFEQGADSSPVTITASAIGDSDAGTVTVKVLDLPPDVTVRFGSSGSFSTAPSTTLSVGVGGSAQTTLTFRADQFASPFPIFVTIQGTTNVGPQTIFVPIDTGIISASDFFNFDGSVTFGTGTNFFTIGSLLLSPSSGQSGISATSVPGDLITVSASGFPPGATITSFTFGGVVISLPVGSDLISATGTFTQQIIVPDDLFEGFNFVELIADDGAGNIVSAFADYFVIGAGDLFTVNASPQFLNSVSQGQDTDPVTVTIDAISGRDPGSITIEVFGLPFGVTGAFDSDSDGEFIDEVFSSFPNLSTTLAAGETQSFTLKFRTDEFAPPGPVFVDLIIFDGTSLTFTQEFFVPIDFGIIPSDDFFDVFFLAGLTGFNPFQFGSISVFPPEAKEGDPVTITATGFTSNGIIEDLFFGPIQIGLPQGQTFGPGGDFSITIATPGLDSGFHFVEICEVGGFCAETFFEKLPGDSTFTLDVSPQMPPPAPQGQTIPDGPVISIVIDAFDGRTPGSNGDVDITLFGVPPFVDASFSTDNGDTFPVPSTDAFGNPIVTVNVPTGGNANLQLTFGVDEFAPPTFIPLFLLAETDTGEAREESIDFGIAPSVATGNTFGVGSLSLDPRIGQSGDPVLFIASGFRAGAPIVIDFGGVIISETTGNLPAGTNFDSTGFASFQILVPGVADGLLAGIHPVTVTDSDVIDASTRIATDEFFIVPASDTFDLQVSPIFLQPTEQGQTSEIVSITIQALLGQIPGPAANGDVVVTIFGLPPGVIPEFNGVPVASLDDPSFTINLPDPGSQGTVDLALAVAANTQPGFYFVTLEADDTNVIRFVDIDFPILPGGDLADDFASITVTPGAGEVGDPVVINSFGFTPGEPVFLEFGGFTIDTGASTFEAPDGTFGTSVQVPDVLEPGFYAVTISDGTDRPLPPGSDPLVDLPDPRQAAEVFEVLAPGTTVFLSVTPDYLTGIQGSQTDFVQITLDAAFGQDPDPTTIIVQGIPPFSSAVFAESGSSFATGLVVADAILDPGLGQSENIGLAIDIGDVTPPGLYTIFITAENTIDFTIFPIELSVAPNPGVGLTSPSFVIDPAAVPAGDDLAFTGQGFEPLSSFTTIGIRVPGQPFTENVPLFGTITIGADGTFATILTCPFDATPGTYEVIITSGSTTAVAPLTILPFDDNVGFFDVFISPEIVTTVQGAAFGAAGSATGIFTFTSFNGFSDDVEVGVFDLAPGIQIRMSDLAGTVLATFTGTIFGTTVTPDLPLLSTTAGDIIYQPGGSAIIQLDISAGASTPVGSYYSFLEAFNGDFAGEDLFIDVISLAGEPSLSFNPSSGSEGSFVSLSGSGFTIGNQININIASLDLVVPPVTVPDPITVIDDGFGLGVFSAQLTIPALDPGIFPIIASDQSGNSADGQFQVFPSENTFALQLTPRQIIVPANDFGTQNIIVRPIGIFTEAITLSIDPATPIPVGVDVDFDSSTPGLQDSITVTPIPGIVGSIRLTLTDTTGTQVGLVPFNIIGTPTSATPISEPATISFVGSLDFTVSAAPDDIVVERGGTVDLTIEILTIGNFEDPLNLGTNEVASITVIGLELIPGFSVTAGDGANVITSNFDTGIGLQTLSFAADIDPLITELGSFQFTIDVAFDDDSAALIALGTKTVTVNLLVIDVAPTGYDIQTFDPNQINQQTPLNLDLDDPGSNFDPQITILALTTTTSGSTSFDASFNLDPAIDLAPLPDVPRFLPLDVEILNISPNTGTTSASLELCLPIPDPAILAALGLTVNDLQLMFIDPDTGDWTLVDTFLVDSNGDGSNDLVCTNTDHFSSWGIGGIKALAIAGAAKAAVSAAAPSAVGVLGGGGSGGGGGDIILGTPGVALPTTTPKLPGGAAVTTVIAGNTFEINYQPLVQGEITQMSVDRATKSVKFSLTNVKAGQMLINIPRSLLNAPDNNFNVFVTASPEEQIDYEITRSTAEYVTISVLLPEGAKELRIQGVTLLPEPILDTTAHLYEVSWDICETNIFRLVAGPIIPSLSVKLRTTSGLIIPELAVDQPYDNRAVYEAILSPGESYVMVQVESVIKRQASLAQESFDLKECTGFVTVEEPPAPVPTFVTPDIPEIITPSAVTPTMPGGVTFDTTYNNIDFEINYKADQGTIADIIIDEPIKSVKFMLDGVTEAGELVISIPRILVDAEDDQFFIFVEGLNQDYQIIESTGEYVTINIQLPADATAFSIVGTSIVPEFGVVAFAILLVSIVAVIAITRTQRMTLAKQIQ